MGACLVSISGVALRLNLCPVCAPRAKLLIKLLVDEVDLTEEVNLVSGALITVSESISPDYPKMAFF